MMYIVLAVLTSVLLLVGFKLFGKYNVNTFQAIVINYITAAITGLFFSQEHLSVSGALASDWIKVSLPLGALFVGIFYLISQTAQRISISTASVSNKMSVVITVGFSVLILGDQLNIIKSVGIILAIAAVMLTTYVKKESGTKNNLWWLPVLVFIGSGLIDILISGAKKYYIHSSADDDMFSISTFLSAFFIGAIILLYLLIVKKHSLPIKSIVAGVLLGIPNYFSIFFILKALNSGVLSNAQLFPVLNISNVTVAAFVGILLFKEKLSNINLIGISLAVIAILLIAY